MKPGTKALPITAADATSGPHAWTEVNPRYGRKSEFRKITATLPQWAYELLIQESARRKIAGEPNQLLSALLREAITDYLNRLHPDST